MSFLILLQDLFHWASNTLLERLIVNLCKHTVTFHYNIIVETRTRILKKRIKGVGNLRFSLIGLHQVLVSERTALCRDNRTEL